jgi:hypothetical protein
MTVWSPTTTSSSMWQEYKVQFDPTVTLYPTYTFAFMPVGRLAAVCTTELSPIDEKFMTL